MRTLVSALLALLILPLATAHTIPASEDETLALGDAHEEGTLYLKVCFAKKDLVVPDSGDLIDECTTSGLWQESNGVGHLQVRAGIEQDASNGPITAFVADHKLLS